MREGWRGRPHEPKSEEALLAIITRRLYNHPGIVITHDGAGTINEALIPDGDGIVVAIARFAHGYGVSVDGIDWGLTFDSPAAAYEACFLSSHYQRVFDRWADEGRVVTLDMLDNIDDEHGTDAPAT